jgi:putative hemolysin
MTIDDFNESVGTQLPTDGPRTMAGLILDLLGHHPEPGESVEVEGCTLEVEEVDGLRITRIKVTVPAGTRAGTNG